MTSTLRFWGIGIGAIAIFSGCAASTSQEDTGYDDEEVRSCRALTTTSAAKLMPAGSSQATVGRFELQASRRPFNDLTGAGAWSAWEVVDSGDTVFETTNTALDGNVIAMTLAGQYEQRSGGNRVTWNVASTGLVSNNDEDVHTTELRWFLRANAHWTATFKMSNVRATTCAIDATSELVRPDQQPDEQYRYRLRVKFKR